MITNLRDLLKQDEGVKTETYYDSLGYVTGGVGHLLDPRKGGSIPMPIVIALLDYDIVTKTEQLVKALPWVSTLDEVRHAVLVSMAFNLGVSGLLGFKNTLEAVRTHRYDDAAAAMLASSWASQVGARAGRLSRMMASGAWPT